MTAQVSLTGGLFTVAQLDGAQVVLKKQGQFRQVQVYRRQSQLFAKLGSNFIALHRNGSTSVPDWGWDTIEGVEYYVGDLGRIYMGKEVKLEKPKRRRPTTKNK